MRASRPTPRAGASPGRIETELDACRILRLRTNTVLRHLREFNRVLDCALTRGVIDHNPLAAHMYSQGEVKRMLLLEEENARLPWGDRIQTLFRSPKFREPLEEPGDPMFWAPLISAFLGLRCEEVLQLATKNFKSDGGIPFIHVTNGAGQVVKSEAARRSLPVHRSLITLGLLELVELRRRQGETRLFPWITRGKSKQKFS